MDRDVASAIAAIGDIVSPETLEASRALYADAHEQPPYDGVEVTEIKQLSRKPPAKKADAAAKEDDE